MKMDERNPFGSLSPDKLANFERSIGVALPNEYREYLLNYNGGGWNGFEFFISKEEGDSVLQYFYGIHDGPDYSRLDKVHKRFRGRIPPGFLPIARDVGGNQICIKTSSGRAGSVHFWDHEKLVSKDKDMAFICETFSGFLNSLEKAESSSNQVTDAINNGDVNSLRQILDAGLLDLESADENGRTVIERATIKGHLEMIEFLVNRGARLGDSLKLAELNAQFFDKHKAVVELIKKLSSEQNN